MTEQTVIGVGKADITPPMGIVGRQGLNHTLDLAGHPCLAKALYIEGSAPGSGSSQSNYPILQITCELVGLPGSVIQAIHERLENEMGIHSTRVILTATHSHSSPWVWDVQDREASLYGFELLDRVYLEKIIAGCLEAAKTAKEDAAPRLLRSGAAVVRDVASNRVQFGWRGSICRDNRLRDMPVGDIDPSVRILAICSVDGEPLALIANYACHPSSYGGGRTLFSSPDFPYHAEACLKEHFGREIPLFYWMGCTGDINPGKFVAEGSHAESMALGKRLADGIMAAWQTSSALAADVHINHTTWTCPLETGLSRSNRPARASAQSRERRVKPSILLAHRAAISSSAGAERSSAWMCAL